MKIDPATQSVEVGGVDVSAAIRRVTVDLQTGRQAEVFLEIATGSLLPEVLELDGIVHVVREQTDPGPIVLAWLETVEPTALEALVLADSDMSVGMGQGFLEQLAKLAADG